MLVYNPFTITDMTPAKGDSSVTNITSCLKCKRLTVALAKFYGNGEFSTMLGREFVFRKVAEALKTVLPSLGVTIGLKYLLLHEL